MFDFTTKILSASIILMAASVPALAGDELEKLHPPRQIVAPEVVEVAGSEPIASHVRQQMLIDGGTVQSLVLERLDDGVFRIPIVIDGEVDEIVLAPHSFRSPEFQVLVPGPSGNLVPLHPLPEPTTYQGVLEKQVDSIIAASIFDDQITAYIMLNDGTWRYVQPIQEYVPTATRNQHVVYSGTDTPPMSRECGVHSDLMDRPSHQIDDLPHGPAVLPDFSPDADIAADDLHEPQTNGGMILNNPVLVAYNVTVAFDADFQYYQANNSSVTQTIAAIEAVMAGVNIVYERDTFIRHNIGTIIVRTSFSDNPYSTNNPDLLLEDMRDHWNANHTNIPRSLAHLFTGVDLAGNTIGIAFLDVVCDSITNGSGYGLSQVTSSTNADYRIALVAHELGHNWSANHCNQSPHQCSPCHIMCSTIDDCSGFGAPEFTHCSRTAINTFAATASCAPQSSNMRWVDFNHGGSQSGTFLFPFSTLAGGVNSVPSGGAIAIKPGNSNETFVITKPMNVYSWNGEARVGQ